MHSVGTMDTNLPAHSSSYKLGSTEYLSTKKISFEIQMLYYRYVHFVGPHTPPPPPSKIWTATLKKILTIFQ